MFKIKKYKCVRNKKVISMDSPKKSYNLFPLRSETNYRMNSQYILTCKSRRKLELDVKAKTKNKREKRKNKVIRPKSCALSLSKHVRQTDRQTFFSKRHLKWPFVPQRFFSTIQRHEKRFEKP